MAQKQFYRELGSAQYFKALLLAALLGTSLGSEASPLRPCQEALVAKTIVWHSIGTTGVSESEFQEIQDSIAWVQDQLLIRFPRPNIFRVEGDHGRALRDYSRRVFQQSIGERVRGLWQPYQEFARNQWQGFFLLKALLTRRYFLERELRLLDDSSLENRRNWMADLNHELSATNSEIERAERGFASSVPFPPDKAQPYQEFFVDLISTLETGARVTDGQSPDFPESRRYLAEEYLEAADVQSNRPEFLFQVFYALAQTLESEIHSPLYNQDPDMILKQRLKNNLRWSFGRGNLGAP